MGQRTCFLASIACMTPPQWGQTTLAIGLYPKAPVACVSMDLRQVCVCFVVSICVIYTLSAMLSIG